MRRSLPELCLDHPIGTLALLVAVAVAGRDPTAVASALNGGLPGKVAGVRRRSSTLVVLLEPHEGATRRALATRAGIPMAIFGDPPLNKPTLGCGLDTVA